MLFTRASPARIFSNQVTNLTGGAYDPTVLVDDDGATYLCLGLRLGGSYVVARLEPSLVALAYAAPPTPIIRVFKGKHSVFVRILLCS